MLLLFLCLNEAFNSTCNISRVRKGGARQQSFHRCVSVSIPTFIRCSSTAVWKCDVDRFSCVQSTVLTLARVTSSTATAYFRLAPFVVICDGEVQCSFPNLELVRGVAHDNCATRPLCRTRICDFAPLLMTSGSCRHSLSFCWPYACVRGMKQTWVLRRCLCRLYSGQMYPPMNSRHGTPPHPPTVNVMSRGRTLTLVQFLP